MSGCFKVFFCLADCSFAVQGLGGFRPDVRIRDRNAAVGKNLGLRQALYPAFPIFTAHNLNGCGSFFFVRGFRRNLFQLAGKRIERFSGKRFAEGLEYGFIHNARVGIGPHGAGQAVYDQIEPYILFFRFFDNPIFYFIGKGISVYRARKKPRIFGRFIKGQIVVPAGCSPFGFAAGFFIRHADCRRAVCKGGRYAACQSVAVRTAQHQNVFGRAVLCVRSRFLFRVCNLIVR